MEAGKNQNHGEWWAILAVLGVFLLGLPGLLAWSAERTLLDAYTYTHSLQAQRVYQEYPVYLRAMLANGTERLLPGAGDLLGDALARSGSDAVARAFFPPEWVEQQTESVVRAYIDALGRQAEPPVLPVDLRPIKARMQGEAANEVAAALVQGLPGCTPEEVLEFSLQALSGTLDNLPLCRPPEALQGLVLLVVSRSVQVGVSALPERIDLGAAIPAAAWARLSGLARLVRVSAWLLPLLALILLLATGILARRTARGPFVWMGAALLLTGAALVTMVAILGLGAAQAAALSAAARADADPTLTSLLGSVLAGAAREWLKTGLLAGLSVIAVGVAVAGAGWWVGSRQ